MISAQNDFPSSDLRTRYRKYKNSRDFYIEYVLELQKWGKQQKNDCTKFIKRPCPICKIQEHSIAFEAPVYTFVRCDKCGLIYANEILNDSEIKKFYENNAIYQKIWEKTYHEIVAAKSVPTHAPLVDKILRYRKGGGSCLDIGSGHGKLLFELKPYFSKVEGIELNEVTSKQSEELFNIRIFKSKLEELGLPDESYDVVILNQVIEHLNSLDLFDEISRILKPNGMVFIGCPNADSLSMRLLKGAHIHVSSIAHINMFNCKSIEYLADKFDLGLESFSITDKLDIDINDIILYRGQDYVHRYSYNPVTLPISLIFSNINLRISIGEKVASRTRGGSYLEAILRKRQR
jgi:2-polyprenyl-3-methyl-5-hydroxy-6-metoxy-1,4-benzoquinol methylase